MNMHVFLFEWLTSQPRGTDPVSWQLTWPQYVFLLLQGEGPACGSAERALGAAVGMHSVNLRNMSVSQPMSSSRTFSKGH